ncbi:MAG: DUF4339 domain-containing protein [Planctomycetota bacterium]|nr:DUF4339 domain-containing protein [Planctomycetota bacterium]
MDIELFLAARRGADGVAGGLIASVVFAVICGAIAHSKGRSVIGYAALGFFLSCIGLIIILCMSNLKAPAARRGTYDARQRGREALDRARPGAHVDDGAAQIAAVAALAGEPVEGSDVKEWFFEHDGESRGPVSEVAIRTGLRRRRIRRETLIWRDGMPDWLPAGEVLLFASEFTT